MLSLPDFRSRKIIFIDSTSEEESRPNNLKIRNFNIMLYRGDEFINQISIHLVFAIFIIGPTTITSYLLRKAQEYGISIFLLNRSFRVESMVVALAAGNYKLRKAQYTESDASKLIKAKELILNKLENQYRLAKKLGLENELVTQQYKSRSEQVLGIKDVQKLLGVEGSFARLYFKTVFNEFGWYRRAPRTKEDIPNLLLDIGYTFLFNYVDALLNLFGFDTYMGFYHKLFFQRRSLSTDIMEPLRPVIDYALIKAYHLGRINEKDFKFKDQRFYLNPKKNKHYSSIFFDAISYNKEKIYQYTLLYYRHVMNPRKYKFPKVICF